MPKVIPLNPEPVYVCNLSLTEKEVKYLFKLLGNFSAITCKEYLKNSKCSLKEQTEGYKLLLDNDDSIYNELSNFFEGEVDE